MNFEGNEDNDQPRGIEEWYMRIPPITRVYMTLCVLTTLAVQLDIISPLDIFLEFNAVFKNYEFHRLLTTFLFFGYFDINFIFHMYFLYRHSSMLEENQYHRRSADYLLLWIFSGLSILLLYFFVSYFRIAKMSPILAPSLTSVIVYVWSKCNPHLRMSFLYLFTFSAPWLPWVILSLGWVLGQDPVDDLIGIGIGHLYYFLYFIHALLPTPRALKALLGQEE